MDVTPSAMRPGWVKDIAFRRKELERWKSALGDCEVHAFEDCGHFLGRG